MSFFTIAFLSFFILIPVTIGLVRFRKIHKSYYPFIFALSLGLLNEIISLILVNAGYYNTINGNIFMLLEAGIFVSQFRKWKLFNYNLTMYLLWSFLLTCWLVEVYFIYNITRFASYFLIIYSSLLSVLSIFLMNKLLIRERKNLFRNPVFIICLAFLLYYPFSVLSEAFWIYSFGHPGFSGRIHSISVFFNFIAILLYSLAILWMPTRQNFTLPSL